MAARWRRSGGGGGEGGGEGCGMEMAVRCCFRVVQSRFGLLQPPARAGGVQPHRGCHAGGGTAGFAFVVSAARSVLEVSQGGGRSLDAGGETGAAELEVLLEHGWLEAAEWVVPRRGHAAHNESASSAGGAGSAGGASGGASGGRTAPPCGSADDDSCSICMAATMRELTSFGDLGALLSSAAPAHLPSTSPPAHLHLASTPRHASAVCGPPAVGSL
mmetsp:Transcript_17119/g.55719  ORF Transcript_17119/g.55719 Transcript_17119/m.55719 type:complete len:217 (+) Transcript_17119:1130-1780(+)